MGINLYVCLRVKRQYNNYVNANIMELNLKKILQKISFKGRLGVDNLPIHFFGGQKTLQGNPLVGFLWTIPCAILFIICTSLAFAIFPGRRIVFYATVCPLVAVLSIGIPLLGTLFASFAVRRLHDVGKSGWYLLLPLASICAQIIVGIGLRLMVPRALAETIKFIFAAINAMSLPYLVKLLLKEGDPMPNRYGPPPNKKVRKKAYHKSNLNK